MRATHCCCCCCYYSRFSVLQVASIEASESAWRRTPSRRIRMSFLRWLRSNAQRGRKETCTESKPQRQLLFARRKREEKEQQIIVGWWEFRWLTMTIVTLQYYYYMPPFFVERARLHHYYGKYYTRMSGQELGDGIQWRGSIRRRLGRTSMDFGSVFKGQLKNILMIRRNPNRSQTWTKEQRKIKPHS